VEFEKEKNKNRKTMEPEKNLKKSLDLFSLFPS
jgi:hypothetical protein